MEASEFNKFIHAMFVLSLTTTNITIIISYMICIAASFRHNDNDDDYDDNDQLLNNSSVAIFTIVVKRGPIASNSDILNLTTG